MKKIILFMTILLVIGTGSYSAVNNSEKIDEVNKELVKELSLFYGDYETIYSNGIDKQNIYFILGEIGSGTDKNIEYDFEKLSNGNIITLGLDEKIYLKNISQIERLKIVGKTYKNAIVDFKKENNNLKIGFSSIGEYKIFL